MLAGTAGLARAQRADENAVTAAQDAFGTSIGNEQIGLYSAGEIRGFSPIDAGNVRIEGFWFDLQGSLNPRLVEGSTVRVGLTAQGYPFPAPTGIVDYRLRKAGDSAAVSVVSGLDDYRGPFAELDARLPVVAGRLSVAGGVSYSLDEYYDGSDASVASLAVIPRWRPLDGVELVPFWSFAASRDEEVAPLIITSGPYLPPQFPRRRYYAQPWADLETNVSNLGLLASARLGAGFTAAAGVFRSVRDVPIDHADLFVETQPDGAARELVIADPPQRRASTGGELSATRTFGSGRLHHQLRARLVGRLRTSRFGGSSQPLALGDRMVGTPIVVDQPRFETGVPARDRVRQWTAGLAYEGRWPGVGELVAGLQRTSYHQTVDVPGLARSGTDAGPWLVNATLAVHASERLAVYAGYTRGLEETGIAPGNAANRNQALPAIVTRQIDAGLRVALGGAVRLVAGVFDVRKPYFTTDEQAVFAELGEVRHRGLELSLAGEIFNRFTVVTGAVVMQPRVAGPAVEAGRIGPEPVGQTDRTVRINLDYRLPVIDGLSLDLGALHTGERVASSDNLVAAPALTTVDAGARYRFSLLGRPATVRLQVKNAGDAYGWRVLGSNAFRTSSPRAIAGSIAVDL